MKDGLRETLDLIEEICWILNFYEGETLSTDELAEIVDLEWAEVYSILQTIEVLNRMEPSVSLDSGDVTVTERNKRFENYFGDVTPVSVTTYIFMLQRIKMEPENMTDPVKIETHEYLRNNENVLDEASSLGWLEKDSETVSLTPTGTSIVGPIHSKFRNTDEEPNLPESDTES